MAAAFNKSPSSAQAHCQVTNIRESLSKGIELWFPDGDCDIYLYKESQSLRGPSFRLPYHILCHDGLNIDNQLQSLKSSTRDSAVLFENEPQYSHRNIYIPAPEDATIEQTYTYHTTTRNCFRCLANKPLISSNLGLTYVEIVNRLAEWTRSRRQSISITLECLENQGYFYFPNNPEQAAAALFLAEQFQISSLWVDAYAHCVGMYSVVRSCRSFQGLSRTASDAVSKSAKEIEPRIEAARILLLDFDTLPWNIHPKLSSDEYEHLKDFVTFLSHHFIEKLGARSLNTFEYDRNLYHLLQNEFQSLYDTLVDRSAQAQSKSFWDTSTTSMVNNLMKFDVKNNYRPLPHIIPQKPCSIGTNSSKHSLINTGANRFLHSIDRIQKRGHMPLEPHKQLPEKLRIPFNSAHIPLSDKYTDFTSRCIGNIPAQEARLLDWTVIYSILQTLLWVTSAPKGVHHCDSTQYALCLGSYIVPPWSNSNTGLQQHNVSDIMLRSNTTGHPFNERLRRHDTDLHHQTKQHSRSISTPERGLAGFPYAVPSSTSHTKISSSLPAEFHIPPRTSSQRKTCRKYPRRRSSVSKNMESSVRRSYIEIIVPSYGNGIIQAEANVSPKTPNPRDNSDLVLKAKGSKGRNINRFSWSHHDTPDTISQRSSTDATDESRTSTYMSSPTLCDSSSSYSQSTTESFSEDVTALGYSILDCNGDKALNGNYECQVQEMEELFDWADRTFLHPE